MSSQLQLHPFIICVERKVKPKCEICQSSFKFGKAEHMCKRCCRAVCDDCGPHKLKCYMSDYKNVPHRVCRVCHVESEALHKYVKTNHLKWGQDSDLVRLWLKKLGLKAVPKKRGSEKRRAKQYVSFMDIWKSLNFSFREFIGLVIDEAKVSEAEISELINLSLNELSSCKLADLQHCIYILLFFLAHCSAHHAVYFTTLIIQMVYTEQMSTENIHYFLQQMNCSQNQVYKMQALMQQSLEKMVKRCTINVFTAEVSIEVMSHLIMHRELEELEKGISYVFSERKQFICQNSNKPDDVLLDILRNTSSANYRRVAKSIENSMSPSSRSEGRPRSQASLGSLEERSSDRLSSRSNRSGQKVEHILKENQELKILARNQELEIEQLRVENQLLKSRYYPAAGKEMEKKANSINFLPRGSDESNLFRQTINLSDKNEACSTEGAFNEDPNFNDIIHRKNQQILKLKRQLTEVRDSIKDMEVKKPIACQSESQSDQRYQVRKNNKEKEQIEKLKQENQSLANVNRKMHMKLQELSNLLMDKQEKTMRLINERFDSMSTEGASAMTQNEMKEKIKQQCNIF